MARAAVRCRACEAAAAYCRCAAGQESGVGGGGIGAGAYARPAADRQLTSGLIYAVGGAAAGGVSDYAGASADVCDDAVFYLHAHCVAAAVYCDGGVAVHVKAGFLSQIDTDVAGGNETVRKADVAALGVDAAIAAVDVGAAGEQERAGVRAPFKVDAPLAEQLAARHNELGVVAQAHGGGTGGCPGVYLSAGDGDAAAAVHVEADGLFTAGPNAAARKLQLAVQDTDDPVLGVVEGDVSAAVHAEFEFCAAGIEFQCPAELHAPVHGEGGRPALGICEGPGEGVGFRAALAQREFFLLAAVVGYDGGYELAGIAELYNIPAAAFAEDELMPVEVHKFSPIVGLKVKIVARGQQGSHGVAGFDGGLVACEGAAGERNSAAGVRGEADALCAFGVCQAYLAAAYVHRGEAVGFDSAGDAAVSRTVGSYAAARDVQLAGHDPYRRLPALGHDGAVADVKAAAGHLYELAAARRAGQGDAVREAEGQVAVGVQLQGRRIAVFDAPLQRQPACPAVVRIFPGGCERSRIRPLIFGAEELLHMTVGRGDHGHRAAFVNGLYQQIV